MGADKKKFGGNRNTVGKTSRGVLVSLSKLIRSFLTERITKRRVYTHASREAEKMSKISAGQASRRGPGVMLTRSVREPNVPASAMGGEVNA